ncbi:MAG TPA: hypothetical protein VGJ60_20405 [Chloroflexota bacterium]
MNVDALVVVGAIIGALAGSVSFLFRQLVIVKNRRINELLDERDYWRHIVIIDKGLPDYEAFYEQQHRPLPGGRETYLEQKDPD